MLRFARDFPVRIFAGMEQLWSPWRSKFVGSASQAGNGGESPFTTACNEPEKDLENHVVYRGERAFIIMNRYPYNAGHLLVVPNREVGDFLALSHEESVEIMRLLRLGVGLLRRALMAESFNVGMNLGRTAGAAIETHVHFHIVPRWNGDTNFMPVLDETRVISEEMDAIYAKVCDALRVMLESGEMP